jgi:hypothetical protein
MAHRLKVFPTRTFALLRRLGRKPQEVSSVFSVKLTDCHSCLSVQAASAAGSCLGLKYSFCKCFQNVLRRESLYLVRCFLLSHEHMLHPVSRTNSVAPISVTMITIYLVATSLSHPSECGLRCLHGCQSMLFPADITTVASLSVF